MADRPRFSNGAIYHIYNRGVEKRSIFEDEKDHFRFIHDLYEFNDQDPAENSTFYYGRHGEPRSFRKPKKRKHLVRLLAYALMPNHYHLLLMQQKDSGVSLFMKKLAAGYTKYFNRRHERSGVLFQGKYKLKPVLKEDYLQHLVSYIHLNPMDVLFPGWRKGGLSSPETAERELARYRWSSYPDYAGKTNFPSLLDTNIIEELALPWGNKRLAHVRNWPDERTLPSEIEIPR